MANKIKVPVGELQALRVAAGLSQKAVATRLNLGERNLNDWESGRRLPILALHRWLELAEAYGVSIMALNRAIEKDFSQKEAKSLDNLEISC